MFVRVPKEIIKYSIEQNRLILPLYLYSGFNVNQYNNFIVSTNIPLLVETFTPNEDSRHGWNGKYIQAMQILAKGVQGEFSECIQFKSPPNLKGADDFFNYQNKVIENINKTNKLEYYFLNRDIQMANKFTMVDSNEYFYLVDSINIINNFVPVQVTELRFTEFEFNKKKWNLVDLINFYIYLKMQIEFFDMISENQGVKTFMKESVDTMAKKFHVGTKTIVKYINELKELSMIQTDTILLQNKKITEYTLDNSWRNEDGQ